jgi:hypothetical protein
MWCWLFKHVLVGPHSTAASTAARPNDASSPRPGRSVVPVVVRGTDHLMHTVASHSGQQYVDTYASRSAA